MTTDQITIAGKTYCRIHDGSWIGPDLREPSLITRLQLEIIADEWSPLLHAIVGIAALLTLAACVYGVAV